MKKGHTFSSDLKASPFDQPLVGVEGGVPLNSPKTPPMPTVHFDDPPKSMSANLPSMPDSPEEEGSESPAVEATEKKNSMIYS